MLKCRKAVGHLHHMHLSSHETSQLMWQNKRFVNDTLHERLQLGWMGRCQHDTRLTQLQVLDQGSVGYRRVRIEQISLITISLTDCLDNLIVVVTVGMDVTANVLVTTQEFHNTSEVVRTSGI